MSKVVVSDGQIKIRTSLFPVSIVTQLEPHQISSVRVEPDAGRRLWKGLMGPAVNLPGVVAKGLFWRRGRRELWDVTGRRPALAIEVTGEGLFSRVVVDVPDPEKVAESIRALQIRD